MERSAKKNRRMNSSGQILGCNPSALKCGRFKKKRTWEAIKGQNCNRRYVVALVLNDANESLWGKRFHSGYGIPPNSHQISLFKESIMAVNTV